ncbi:MAG: chorismate synthase [Deltaproteobacteria bacterium]|nr:chorismate synthase [Deltaproteobacteria bacterium]
MSNVFGELLRVTTFGESHGPLIGAVVDGLPAGLPLDEAAIQADLDRRRPGASELTSPRDEPDRVRIVSGVFEGRTTGAPVALLVANEDVRTADYAAWRDCFRPGHGDWTWWKKYGVRDWRGGGRLSGRETVARVAAGAVARRLLERRGVRVAGQVLALGGVVARDPDLAAAAASPLRCGDPRAERRMAAALRKAREAGDSLGGIVEVRALGVPPGWGEPVFGKLDARLGGALLSLGAVKGVEFGDGFALAVLRGSKANDPLTPRGFASNRAGGVLGGISNGEPLVIRLAVKPTPTLGRPQATVDVRGRARTLRVPGRHDPCVAPRLVAVAEAMTALVLADAALLHDARRRAGPDSRRRSAPRTRPPRPPGAMDGRRSR